MFDHSLYSQAFSSNERRQWISNGTVDPDTPEAPSTRFKDEDGGPLLPGPLVSVTLQPSGISVVCRVGSFIAGQGEGSWMPFMQGDEVLVALPQGMEGGNPIIIARMNQEFDAWPNTVAGQDATKNTFGFWRLRNPFIVESAESFLIRSAKTGAQIGIDSEGQVILNQGDRHNLFLGSDAINLGDGDQTIFLQLNFNEQRFTVGVNNSRLELSAAGASILQCAGSLNIGTSSVAGKGHAVTIEQVIGLLINWTILLASSSFGSTTLMTDLTATGKLLSNLPSAFPAQFDTALFTMLGQMAVGTNLPSSSTNGGNYSQFIQTFGPGGLPVLLLNPLSLTDPTGFVLGVARGSLML